MAGLKLSVCFWHLDPLVTDDVLVTLKEGKFDVQHCHYKEREQVRKRLIEDPPDLVISDFDLPDSLRAMIEEEMGPYLSEVPLIYLVGEKNARKAAQTLESGVWDFVQKEQIFKLVPSVYSSQKYANVIKERQKAEHDLLESRDRYMSIFNSVHDGILLIDFESRKIADYNPTLLEIFGFDEEDMNSIDMNLYSVSDEGYTLEVARKYVKKASAGKPVSFEWRNIKKSGEKFWTHNSMSIVQIDKVPHILLVTRNIDEQKKLTRSLMESQEHFRALAENSPDVIMHFDRDHRHLYVNGTASSQTGIPIEDFLNKSHREMGIFPEKLVDLWEKALDKVFKTGKSDTIVFDFERADGNTTFEWRLYPETGRSEAIDSVIGVARDITDSVVSEDALRRSEERLNLALSGANLGFWDWNLLNDEVYLSPIWFSMLGYGPDELPQALETWTSLQHPDDMETSYQTVQEVIKNREGSFDIEFRLKNKSGSYVWIRSQGKAVSFDEEGNTTRLTGIHEDINERKRGELVKQVLFDISNAVNSTHSLDELYSMIRDSLGRVVDTTNCFLALYNEEADTLTLPFMEDEKDAFTEFPARKTLTSFV
ncbi:MAG: PAS domain S-box protein, partial [Bacteroidales bacterium]|nr:PAS domain S-box protein [Bacteroidales bacterium]